MLVYDDEMSSVCVVCWFVMMRCHIYVLYIGFRMMRCRMLYVVLYVGL